ncbi:MAG: hypothetical protein R6U36_02925 [Candidatus Fermentibacteraceae bacterium]
MTEGGGGRISLWQVNWKFMLLFMLPGVAMIVASFFVPEDATTDDGYPLDTFLLLFGAFFIVADLGVIGFLSLRNKAKMDFARNALSGTAEVLEMSETGTRINDMPVVRFTLRVNDGYRPVRQVVHKQLLSYLDLRDIHVGDTLDVKVHKSKPDKLLILT